MNCKEMMKSMCCEDISKCFENMNDEDICKKCREMMNIFCSNANSNETCSETKN